MKNFIVGIALMLSMTTVSAGITSDDLGSFDKLTPTQKADVVARMAQFTSANGTTSIPASPEQMKEWVDLGSSIGKGMASIVAELGISIDKFMATSAGKIAMGLLIWKVAGEDIVGVLFAVVWFTTMVPIWIYFFRRMGMGMKIEYPENDKGKPVKTVTYDTELVSTDMNATFFIVMGAIVLVGCLAIFVN